MADNGQHFESSSIQTIILEKGETGYGFNIRGGTDNCHVEDDPGIFVTSMRPDGAAAKDGRLKKGDRIISVNGQNISKVTHETAVGVFRVASEKVVLVVESGAEVKLKRLLEAKAAMTSNTSAASSARAQAAARDLQRRNADKKGGSFTISRRSQIVLFVATSLVGAFVVYKKFDSIKSVIKGLLRWR